MKAEANLSLLETPRLRLRRFETADLAPFLAYRNDPEVARYQSWENCSLREALEFIESQRALAWGLPGRWFQLAIELKETRQLIGDCALKIQEDDARQAEIGFTLARGHQKKGYGRESVSRVLDYGFTELGLHRIIAVTDCGNLRAVALLERLGLRREAHFIQSVWFKGKWGDEYVYAVLCEEWAAARRAVSDSPA